MYPNIAFRDDVNEFPNINCAIEDVLTFTYKIERYNNLVFSIVAANIRSMRENFDMFLAFLTPLAILTETWLTGDMDFTFDIDGYAWHSVYRNQHGGGVAVYYRSALDVVLVPELTFVHPAMEVVSICIRGLPRNIFINAVYRTHNSITQFNQLYVHKIWSNIPTNVNSILIGDFNANLFNPRKLRSIYSFIHNMAGYVFFPRIDKPTRIGKNSFSLLDQIWTNFSEPGINISVLWMLN